MRMAEGDDYFYFGRYVVLLIMCSFTAPAENFDHYYYRIQPSKMSRTLSPTSKSKTGLQVFSEMMLMKFKPKNTDGTKKAIQLPWIRKKILGEERQKLSTQDQNKIITEKLNRILYMQLASRDTVILGNYNQLDMIDLDGLTHGFVDTFHYWSFTPSTPIMNLKVNMKKQVMLIYSLKSLFLYTYDAMKRQTNPPQFVGSIQLKDDIIFMQFATSDLLIACYSTYFEIYYINDSNIIQKKLEKKYNIDTEKFNIFAVPQGIDSTVNIFFQEKNKKSAVFGLWCIQVNLFSQNIRQNAPYKIYDIMNSLKPFLRIENYSKDIIFLNLGQQILLASKGYIVDAVNINIQVQNSFLRLFPQRHILLHIQANFVQIYNFRLNLSVFPHRIQLNSLDSVEISDFKSDLNLLKVLPIFENNFAIFYEDGSHKTSRGEIFYKFMVSYTVKLSEKINRILQAEVPISELSEQRVQRKCDILRKIGLKDEDIYLQIWKRSNQSSVTDYQYLLSTRHYKTIKGEIESKMRKTSMKFKEILRIQQSCLEIIREKLRSPEGEKEDLKDFITCHLLIRKLKLFKEIEIIRTKSDLLVEDRGFFINIQEYYNLKNTEMKQFVLQRIGQFIAAKADNIAEIRTVLYHFRFAYRFVYDQLLQEIIKISKNDLMKVLVAIPQLLPIDTEDESITLQDEGVWRSISQNEWQNSLYLQRLSCIYHKQIIQEVLKDVWFKRNWLIMHDLIGQNAEVIKQKDHKRNSVDIFYFFIDKVFQNIKDETILRNLLHFVEASYIKYPAHLKGLVLLYSKLWEYHLKNREKLKQQRMTFGYFLTLRDSDQFRLFFEYQKVKKNCILKQIYPIYQRAIENGSEIFNASLLNYFKSDKSEISHLKYLLNRINNEKKEFHYNHESMYGVLVKAMQIKMKVGSDNDIPIDDVLIYLENIPITSNQSKEIINDLEMIQKISEESAVFKDMKINMTIHEIVQNYETVMEKLVDYLIVKYKIMSIKDDEHFLTTTYRLLAQLQALKRSIYGENQNQLAFFIYLTKLMQQEGKISFASILLNDEYINNYFYIDISIIENLVQYMYRWKFSQNSAFAPNEQYITALLDLLPEENYLKKFIIEQMKFAKILSSPKEPVRYPLSSESLFPRVIELQQIIKYLQAEVLLKVNIEQVIKIMHRLKELSNHIPTSSHIKGSHFQILQSAIRISITEPQSDDLKDQAIYEEFIKTFITKGFIKQALPLIKKSIQLTTKYDVITILMLIYNIIHELNEESKVLIVKIISYIYQKPLQLLEIVEMILNTAKTGLEVTQYLREEYEKIRVPYLNFNPENLIFSTAFLRIEDDEQSLYSKKQLVKNTLVKLKRIRSQFTHDFLFDFLYIILCFEPHSMAIFLKFVGASKYKLIRSFFSHLIIEEIFNESNVLELMKRVFYFLLLSIKQNKEIYKMVRKYRQMSLVEDFKTNKLEELTEYEKKIEKTYTAFEHKKEKVRDIKKSQKIIKMISEKEASIQQSIKNPEQFIDKEHHQYMFSDSDDDYRAREQSFDQGAPHLVQKRSKQSKIIFDISSQRRDFCLHTPIRSREDMIAFKNEARQSSPAHSRKKENESNQIHASNPIGDLRNSHNKIKKYFSKDVRSGYGDEDNYIDDSLIKEQSRSKEGRKKSADDQDSVYIQQNRRINLSNSLRVDKLKSIGHQIRVHTPERPLKLKSAQSMDMNNISLHFEEDLKELKLQNKKSDEEKSQRKGQKQASLKQVKSQQVIAKSNKENIQGTAKQLLQKLYKTYNSKLQDEPYNLKALSSYRVQNKEDFPKVLKLLIENIYEKPDRSIEIALRLLLQIGKKFSEESKINNSYIEIYQKVAKLELKYGLDLPIQKMLPLRCLYLDSTSADELFQSIKDNVNSVCDNENIFKISKLLSIGFKRNTLEQQILAYYLQKVVIKLNRQKDEEQIQNETEKLKGLVNKLQMRMLLEINDSIIKKSTSAELEKKLVQIFVDAIRMKGNAKEAKDLAARYK